MTAAQSPFVYFETMRLSNVKAFAMDVSLDLTLEGKPAPWTLIIGENGLGKTTLLQCLAMLRPTLNVKRGAETDAVEPDRVEPAMPMYEDSQLISFARRGDGLTVSLDADFCVGLPLRGASPTRAGKRHSVKTSATFTLKADGDLGEFSFSDNQHKDFKTPLVVAYGAGRHAPYRRTDIKADAEDSTASLFNLEIELMDAVTVLEDLDHNKLRGIDRAIRLDSSIRNALARILPGMSDPSAVCVYGPALAGEKNAKTGVWIETYSGEVPLSSLSIGYQTMVSWTIDLAWRMAEHYPNADDPLLEPAIVLMDELDLHLHSKWQRELRRNLSAVFPQVQFIVTTHSPVLAQTYLDTNIAIVRRENDQATIENDPTVVKTWRLDQVFANMFGQAPPYEPEIAAALETRRALLRKDSLTDAEQAALVEANGILANLPTEDDPADQEALDLIRKAALMVATRPK